MALALLLPHHLHLSVVIDKHRSFPQFGSPANPKPIRRPVLVPGATKFTGNDDLLPAAAAAAAAGEESKKPISSGKGFGSAKPDPDPDNGNRKKQKSGRRERGPVIRRNPVERPSFLDKTDGADEVGKELAQIESAFLLTWLALGALILIQGIALAASGFLPDQWDKFSVKYLYPSFTPTVGLFVAGTVSYGVLKYLQNEDAKTSK